MRFVFAVSVLALASPAGLAARAPRQSWGKAGITLAQYRQDALECGIKGHYTDISQTQDAKELVRASRQLDALQGTFAPMASSGSGSATDANAEAQLMGQYAASQQHILYGVRPDQRYRNIKQALESATAQCLVDRGYSRFALTDEQRDHLSKLKAGSDERRAYLYGLASDPSILQAQKLPLEH